MSTVIKVWHWEECSVSFDCPFCHAKEITLCEAGDEHSCCCGARFQLTQSVVITPPKVIDVLAEMP